ncbi:MAG: hypothetical protein HQ583_10225 [Candidatus Abyssubacteria bacterium]|nr:hypothetical protein [Candidatus Abyssubacteria bacterium]
MIGAGRERFLEPIKRMLDPRSSSAIAIKIGEEAILTGRNHPIDFILEGLRLPNMNGSPKIIGIEQKHKEAAPGMARSEPPPGILNPTKELGNEGE